MVANAVARLGIVADTASLAAAERNLQRFSRTTAVAANASAQASQSLLLLNRSTERLAATIGTGAAVRAFNDLTNSIQGLVFTLGSGLAIRQVVRFGDAWQRSSNAIRTVVPSLEAAGAAQEELFRISQRSFSSFESTVQLYSRIGISAKDAVKSQEDLFRIVETVNKALAIGGATAQEQRSVSTQLTQALGSGRLQGDELRSIRENSPILFQAIRDYALEANNATQESFKQLAEQGKITTEVVTEGLRRSADEVDRLFSRFTPTIEQSVEVLRNAFVRITGTVAGPALSQIAQGIKTIADNIEKIVPIAGAAAAALLLAFGPRLVTTLVVAAESVVLFVGNLLGANVAALATRLGLSALQASVVSFTTSLRVAISIINPWTAAVIAVGAALVATVAIFGDFQQATLTSAQAQQRLNDLSLKQIDIINQVVRGTDELARARVRESQAAVAAAQGSLQARRQELSALEEKIKLEQTPRTEVSGAVTGRFAAEAAAARSINRFVPGSLENSAAIKRNDIKQAERELKILQDTLDQVNKAFNDREAFKSPSLEQLGSKSGPVADAVEQIESLTDAQVRYQDLTRERAQLEAQVEVARGGTEAVEQLREEQAAVEGIDGAFQDLILSVFRGNQELARFTKSLSAVADARKNLQTNISLNNLLEKTPAELRAQEVAVQLEIVRLQEKGAKISAEELRTLAEALVLERNRTEELIEQGNEAARLADFATDNFQRNLTRAGDDFFDDFVRKGFGAFKSLGTSLRDTFQQALADELKVNFSANGLGGLFGKDTEFGRSFRESLSGNFKAVGDSIGSFISKSFSRIFGTDAANLGAIAGTLGSAATAASFSRDLLTSTGLGKNRAGQIGSGVGGIAGAGLGFVAGPIGAFLGSAIGSFLGGALGGLFGRTSNEGAGLNLDRLGNTGPILGKRATDETSQLARDAAGRISEGQNLLRSLGAELDSTIRGLVIGTRDKSSFRVSGSTRNEVLSSQTVGDAQELTSAALSEVLRDAVFDREALNKFRDASLEAGRSFEAILESLGQINEILPDANRNLTQFEVAAQRINKTIDDLIKDTEASSAEVAALESARAEAFNALRGDFNKSVLEATQRLENQGLADFNKLLEDQSKRVRDAVAINADLNAVYKLNELEVVNFIEQLSEGGESFIGLSAAFNDIVAAAKAAGQATEPLIEAFDRASVTIRKSFDEDLLSQIGQFVRGPVDELEALLKRQDDRRKEAEALGADLGLVSRLTNLELADFFQSLSEGAIEEVQSFLGLFNEASDSVARVLDLSRQDLQQRADTFERFAQSFEEQRVNFQEQYVAASPREALDILRGRATELLGQVGLGNESAAQALPQVLENLVSRAREQYGNTEAFQRVLSFVNDTLDSARNASVAVQTEAERQIKALDAQVDILGDIRDILQSGEAFNSLFESFARGGVATGDQLLAAIQQGLGLTPNPANSSGANVSIAGVFADVLRPLFTSLGQQFGELSTLEDLPGLQRITIDTIDRGTFQVVSALDRLDERLARIEQIQRQQLAELEDAA